MYSIEAPTKLSNRGAVSSKTRRSVSTSLRSLSMVLKHVLAVRSIRVISQSPVAEERRSYRYHMSKRLAMFGWHYLSKANSLIRPHVLSTALLVLYGKLPLLHYSPLLKKTCVGQVVLDEWFPLKCYIAIAS